MLAVHCRPPEPWDEPVPVPEIRVMPMAGTSELLHWPPFTASPLDDGRLWEYVQWGEIVDLVPSSPEAPDACSGYHARTGAAPGTGTSRSWATCGRRVLAAGRRLYGSLDAARRHPGPGRGWLLTLPGAVDLADVLS